MTDSRQPEFRSQLYLYTTWVIPRCVIRKLIPCPEWIAALIRLSLWHGDRQGDHLLHVIHFCTRTWAACLVCKAFSSEELCMQLSGHVGRVQQLWVVRWFVSPAEKNWVAQAEWHVWFFSAKHIHIFSLSFPHPPCFDRSWNVAPVRYYS
jgi:hypothetical protein